LCAAQNTFDVHGSRPTCQFALPFLADIFFMGTKDGKVPHSCRPIIKMLHSLSNVCFGEAAVRRSDTQPRSAKGRKRQPSIGAECGHSLQAHNSFENICKQALECLGDNTSLGI
jgi:hypothetical protein